MRLPIVAVIVRFVQRKRGERRVSVVVAVVVVVVVFVLNPLRIVRLERVESVCLVTSHASVLITSDSSDQILEGLIGKIQIIHAARGRASVPASEPSVGGFGFGFGGVEKAVSDEPRSFFEARFVQVVVVVGGEVGITDIIARDGLERDLGETHVPPHAFVVLEREVVVEVVEVHVASYGFAAASEDTLFVRARNVGTAGARRRPRVFAQGVAVAAGVERVPREARAEHRAVLEQEVELDGRSEVAEVGKRSVFLR